jgi:hypothetical protein
MSDGNWIELADAIAQLRAQLSAARAEAAGKDVLFTVGKAEIELAVEARREGGGGLGFTFGVLSLEGKGSASSGSTNRLRLELSPHDPAGHDIDVSGQAQQLPNR